MSEIAAYECDIHPFFTFRVQYSITHFTTTEIATRVYDCRMGILMHGSKKVSNVMPDLNELLCVDFRWDTAAAMHAYMEYGSLYAGSDMYGGKGHRV